jgi:hypothetical protein
MARRNSRKNRRGGAGAADPSSYSSAQSFMRATVGSGNQQYNNVFDIGRNNSSSNTIRGLQGQVAGSRKRRTKKGGFWGQIINQGIVPFSILGMQQSFRRKRGGASKTRKHRK